MTLQEIGQVLINLGKEYGISNVKIYPDGDVISFLENRIASKEGPYSLTVMLLEEARQLHINVFLFRVEAVEYIDMLSRITKLNFMLGPYCLVLSPHGILYLKMPHICEDTERGVSPKFFERLVLECISVIRHIEHVLFFEYSLTRGAPKEQTERLASYEFGDNFMPDWNCMMEEIEPVK